jgi:hypothetical protein
MLGSMRGAFQPRTETVDEGLDNARYLEGEELGQDEPRPRKAPKALG